MLQIASIGVALGLKIRPNEDNLIELRQLLAGLYGTPAGVVLGDNGLIFQPPPFTHGEVVIRGNTIRLVDGLTDPIFSANGISVGGAKNALVYDNIVDVPASTPPNYLRDYRCGSVGYLNNRTAAGALVQGLGIVQNLSSGTFTVVPHTDLELEIDDAALLSI